MFSSGMGVVGNRDTLKWEGNTQHIQLYKFQRVQTDGINCGSTNLFKAIEIWMYLGGHMPFNFTVLILPYSIIPAGWLYRLTAEFPTPELTQRSGFTASHMWFPKLTWGYGQLPALKTITGSFHTLFNEFFNPPWSSYTQVHGTLLQQLNLLLDLFQDGRE